MPDLQLELVASLAAKASPAERALLLDVLPPSLASRFRYAPRDTAVLDAFAAVTSLPPTKASEHIATELARYLASAWLIERDRPAAPSPDPLRAALQKVARENGGKTLSPSQLRNIRKGVRR